MAGIIELRRADDRPTTRPSPPKDFTRILSKHAPVRVSKGTKAWIWAGVGFLGFAFLILLVTIKAVGEIQRAGKPVNTEAYSLVIIPAMIGFVCLAMSRLLNPWRPGVAIADEGLVVETRDGLMQIRWEEIAEVRIPLVQTDGWWTYELTNGKTVSFHGDLQGQELFAANHYQVGMAAMVAHRLRRMDAWETVRVGDYGLSLRGLTAGKETIPWGEMSAAVIEVVPKLHQMKLRFKRAGKTFTWVSWNMYRMKSRELFVELIGQAAPPGMWNRHPGRRWI